MNPTRVTFFKCSSRPVRFVDFKGKYVLVDFWVSWCGPCRAENPNVLAAYNRYKDKNFTVVGISLVDKEDKWKKAIQEDKLPWTQVSDLAGRKTPMYWQLIIATRQELYRCGNFSG